MPSRGVTIPETDLAAVRRFCEANSPVEHAHHLRVEYGTRGKAVTIYECRPPWDDDNAKWTRQPIAQLRYNPPDHRWQLYWAGSDDRWHLYNLVEPALRVSALLTEIDRDPTCIFWG